MLLPNRTVDVYLLCAFIMKYYNGYFLTETVLTLLIIPPLSTTPSAPTTTKSTFSIINLCKVKIIYVNVCVYVQPQFKTYNIISNLQTIASILSTNTKQVALTLRHNLRSLWMVSHIVVTSCVSPTCKVLLMYVTSPLGGRCGTNPDLSLPDSAINTIIRFLASAAALSSWNTTFEME